MIYGYHIWSKEALMQAENDDDLDGGQRSSEVKWGKLCAMAAIFGQKKHWCKLRMMMTLMEVKGHQRSNGANYELCTIFGQKNCWCKLRMMMDGGQTSEIMGQTAMATTVGQKNWWCKLRLMVTFMEVKGHQRSNVVKYATKLGRKSSWCKFRMTVTFMEVKGQQRSNTVNNICTTYMIFGE